MARRIFITGGAGFVGGAIIDQLLARGYGVNALVNRKELSAKGDIQSFKGDLFDVSALDHAMSGCDAAIHVVGIIMEKPAKGITFERIHHQGTQSVLAGAVRNGLRRYVHMSALGTRADAASAYHKTKWEAEQAVRASGLDWTIIRPSMIHGANGEFTSMEAKWARKSAPPFLFMPYFGAGLIGVGGAGILQPVYVKDVARAFVDSLDNAKTIGQSYDLGGKDRLTWPQMHQAFANAIVGHRRWVMPLPAWYATLLTKIVPTAWLPFNRDQIIMSQEDNTCDLAHFEADYGWNPKGFSEALGEYAVQLRGL